MLAVELFGVSERKKDASSRACKEAAFAAIISGVAPVDVMRAFTSWPWLMRAVTCAREHIVNRKCARKTSWYY